MALLFINKKINLPLILVPKSEHYNLSTRSFMRATLSKAYAQVGQRTALDPMSYHPVDCRSMTIALRMFINTFSQSNCPDRDAQGIPHHLGSHVFGIDEETGDIKILFTSSKGNKLPATVHIEKVSDEKFNGIIIPLIDPTTKQPLLDANGNIIPNPNKGGQYGAVLPTPRKLSKEAERYLISQDELEKRFPGIMDFFKKNQSKIEAIIQNAQQKGKTSLAKHTNDTSI